MSGRTAVAAALLLLAGPAAAQQVIVLEGSGDVALDRRLERLLPRNPLVITRDTLIAEGDTIARPVLVLDATLILEGIVLDDLVIVDAGAFVRPTAVVAGDLVNIGGGLYRSELATIAGTIIDLPQAEYQVVREPDRIVVQALATESALKFDGIGGLHPPTYDRVEGLTAVWGATYRLPRLGELSPAVHGQVGWHSERGAPTYAADVSFRLGALTLDGGYERVTDTNERWIRNDLRNSLHYVWNGRDYRDYHEVERPWVRLSRQLGDIEKSFSGVLAVRAQREDATSLMGDDPWFIWGDSTRTNPAIDDGRITSVIASFDVVWEGLTTAFEGGLSFELARDWLGEAAEFAGGVERASFELITATGEWEMLALANHTLEIEFHAQLPIGSDTVPRQRWGFVGGSGTLQTQAFAGFYGDHVVFVENKYIIPMPRRLALPVLGAPDLQLIHAAGMAWLADDSRDVRQEVGVRLQFFALYFRYMVEPVDPSSGDFDIGLSWPF